MSGVRDRPVDEAFGGPGYGGQSTSADFLRAVDWATDVVLGRFTGRYAMVRVPLVWRAKAGNQIAGFL